MSTEDSSLTTHEGLKENVIRALQLAKTDLESKHQKANFVRIIMRFPQIKSVFDRLKAIHAKCDADGDGTITSEELTGAMAELINEGRAKGRDPIKPEVVARTLSISEVDENTKDGGLDVKELD